MVDGLYSFKQLESAFSNEFKSEKDLMDFIELNIVDFCQDLLEVTYKSHHREYPLVNVQRSRIKGNRRLDFLIRTQDDKVIVIECKNPTFANELTSAVGQCLAYKSLLANVSIQADRVILVSSKIDPTVPQMIDDYNLPLEFFVMDRNKMTKFIGYASR